MALLTLNGLPVLHGEIVLPRVGVAHADLFVDTPNDLAGSVLLTTVDGAFSIKGTVDRTGIYQNTLQVRVVAGVAGLGSMLPAKFYQGVPLQLPLQDLLSECGETLSPTSDAGMLGTVLKTWTRTNGTGKQALARLLENVGASFRILPDGSLWVGMDSYPSAPNVAFNVLERDFARGLLVMGSEAPFLLPGTTLTLPASATAGIFKVSAVVHHIESAQVRSDVWVES